MYSNIDISFEKKRAVETLRRKQILDVALKLFYKNGYRNTKIADIAEEANISKGLIYRYFSSKSEILFAYREQMDICLNECLTMPTPKDRLREFAKRLFADPDESGYIPPLRVYCTVFITGEVDDKNFENPIYSDFASTFFRPIFKEAIEQKQFRQGDAAVYASIFWHCLLGVVTEIIRNPDGKCVIPNPDAIINIFE